ncbi:MAG: hypothetical protein JXR14_06245 [Paracoccaceae bacterium]
MNQNDNHYEYAKVMNEQANANANIVLRTLLFINGGAAVALLAFIGSIVASEPLKQSNNISELTLPLLWFGWGVVATVIGMGFAYFTTYLVGAHSFALYAQQEKRAGWIIKLKVATHFVAIIATIISLVLFIYGLFDVREAITTLMP